MLDFRIITFLKVCEFMNFTHAAESLNLSQPAVSQHIKYLEEKYNSVLFIREKKNLSLTKAGEILFSAFKTMKNDETKIKECIKENSFKSNRVSFGVTMTIGEYIMLPNLINFIKNNKEINFNIFYKNTNTLLEYLNNGIIDFAIIEGYLESNNYSVIKIKSEEYIAVCSKNHKFKDKISKITDLLDERLIIRENGSGTLAVLSNILSMQNVSTRDFSSTIQVDNMHMVIELLKNDCGISFLYKSAVEKEIKNKTLKQINLKDFKLSRDFSFIWNKNSIFSDYYLYLYKKFQEPLL